MASAACESAASDAGEGARDLEKEITELAADSAPPPCPDGLQERIKQNVLLSAKLAGAVQTEPPGTIADMCESNKENRATAQAQLMCAKTDASHLQQGVLDLCEQVDKKFSEMMKKMGDMSQRIDRLQAQKAVLEKLQEEKAARATFKLGDEEHKTSSVHQQLQQVEERLTLVQRTRKACESAVQDLETWQRELAAKNARLQERIAAEEKRQQATTADTEQARRAVDHLSEQRRSMEEMSGVTVLQHDDLQLALRILPLVSPNAKSSPKPSAATRAALESRRGELLVQFRAPTAPPQRGGGKRCIDSVKLVQANGHPISPDGDISDMLESGDLVSVVTWARRLLKNADPEISS